jgi:hypothetical protein
MFSALRAHLHVDDAVAASSPSDRHHHHLSGSGDGGGDSSSGSGGSSSSSTPVYFPGGNDILTWDAFVWAYSLVESRSFKLTVSDAHGFSVAAAAGAPQHRGPLAILVPFADLFNHHNAFPALQ